MSCALLGAASTAAGTYEIEVRTNGSAPCLEGDRRCHATTAVEAPGPGVRRHGTGAPARPALFLAAGGRGEIRTSTAGGRFCFFVRRQVALVEQCSRLDGGDALEVTLLEVTEETLRLVIVVDRSGKRFSSELEIESGRWTPFARDAAGRRMEVRARRR